MRRVSDTGIVRNYCQNNVGGVFDLNYLSKHKFSDIPNVNLRKIVTRLIDQGILRQVSKGVYLIGESDMSDEDRIIKHYLKDDRGIPTGEYLLYTLGVIDEEPIEKTLKTNLSVGNKKIGNIKVMESGSSFYKVVGARYLITALEIISVMNEIDVSSLLTVTRIIEKYLMNYSDSLMKTYVKDEYPKNVYLKLSSILNSMKIPNKVIDIYVFKEQI